MKALEIILIILIIVIIYPGINYLKKASQKSVNKGSGSSPEKFIGSEYFQPQPIWSEDSQDTYSYAGTCVTGTGNCRIYTYENALVGQQIDSSGNTNLLSSYNYVKPNVDTALQDFVDGNSHLTGRLDQINSDQSGKCIDTDQLNVKYVSKTCLKTGGVNRCLNNKGQVIQPGDSYQYTTYCTKESCPGIISCITLNYLERGERISPSTKCISIKGISVPEKISEVYDLDFYRELGIINTDNTVNVNGPYPIDFEFKACDNTDARQKFKILRYTSKGTSVNLSDNLILDDQGSYAGIIFRGLNSYLDIDKDTGKFVLRSLEGKNDIDSVKWIFFPETKLTNNTIPSRQRCSNLVSNIVSNPTQYSGVGGYKDGRSLVKDGAPMVKNSGNANDMRDNPNTTSDTLVRAGFSASDTAFFFLKRFFLRRGLGSLFRVGAVLAILSIIFNILPDPSYVRNQPFISLPVPKGTRVTPTNFLGDVTDIGPGSSGEATIAPLENICIEGKLLRYPPYFLESVSDNQQIGTGFINYGSETGVHISPRDVFDFGLDQRAYGIFIWNQNAVLNVPSPGNLWQDDGTVWEVKETFSEAIVYPKRYFTQKSNSDSGPVNSVLSDTSKNSTIISSGTYVPSSSGLIKEVDLTNSTTVTDLGVSGRVSGIYVDVPIETSSSAGKDGTFNIDVTSIPISPNNTQTKISSILIDNPGSGYGDGDELKISSDSIGGSNDSQSLTLFVTDVAKEVFIFKAAYVYNVTGQGLKYYLPESIPPENSVFVQGDFEFAATYDSDGKTSPPISGTNPGTIPPLSEDSSNYEPIGLISGGINYKIGDKIGLIQYDYHGNVIAPVKIAREELPLIRYEVDFNKLLTLTVKGIEQFGYLDNQESPVPLTDISFRDFNLNYNFMDTAENVFNSSPQQIVYGGVSSGTGDALTYLASKIKGNITEKTIQNLFLSEDFRDKNTGLITTGTDFSPTNLKSIQVDQLKYEKVSANTDLTEIEPADISGASVVLGRFIPYSSFSPASFNDGNLGYDVSEIYYNRNNAQLIPYGVPDPYNNKAFVTNLPKF